MAKQISAADFAAFLQARCAAGDGYIMCATGQDPKKLSSWWFSGQYSGNQLKKALYWQANAERVWDCNGLAEGYYKEKTGTDINTRARYNYAEWCDPKGTGTIPAAYRVPGAAVFKKSSYIHHVGFLVEPVNADKPSGDWYIVEAKGVMYGVVRTKLSAGGWNCWGWMSKYFDYGDAAQPVAVPDAVLGSRLLKRGAQGADVRQLQQLMIELGYVLPQYGADGDFGIETERALKQLQAGLDVRVDGQYGGETHAALMAMLEQQQPDAQPDAEGVRVRVSAAVSAWVRLGPGTNYGILTVVRRDAEFFSTAQAENGWRMVEVNGGTGWISPRMLETMA